MTEREIKNREYLRTTKPLAYTKVMRYEEQLSNGKSIAMLQIQPSYVCNVYCSHCSVSAFRKQNKPKITVSDIAKLCNGADEYGLAQIDITGGEPLAFKNLEEILKAIGTERFYITIATNAWYLTRKKAFWLKKMGVDRMLISLDSLDGEAHDQMRNCPGIYQKAISAIDYVKEAGMDLKITSILTHDRTHSEELKHFVDFIYGKGVAIEAQLARPVGEWKGRLDLVPTAQDIKFLEDTYGMSFHTSTHYGMDMGCLAVKKIITVTAFGDVIPCIWMYYSLGNILTTPFKEIMDKGMKLFCDKKHDCRMVNPDFLKKYNEITNGRELPISIEEVM